ncbi:MAG TPA: tyrosine-type recombinase/integrase [Terriglobia bacterium]
MKKLRKAVKDYGALRRALGFKLEKVEVGLLDFVSFLKRQGSSHITTACALQWATRPSHVQPIVWAQRLSFVRGFARHGSATDPRTEIPPWRLLPYRPLRARPYLYSEDEIRRLLKAAQSLPSRHPLRPWTYYCLFGTLVVTGLRLGEVLKLRTGDTDWSEGVLTIRDTKFGKSRLVPLHPSTCKVLAAYAKRRNSFFGARGEAHFFVNQNGNRLDKGEVHRTFYALSRQIGLRAPSVSHGPRLHDFRHRLAIQTWVQWYRSGQDVERLLPVLSTYLGHAHVTDTYGYLSTSPELMGLARERMERRWEVRP